MEYAYTEENQVSQKSEFAGNIRQNTYFRYDALHRRTQVGTSSTWWKYTYDTLGRVATQRFTVSGADILTETVSYNNANQVTSIQKVTPENTRTHSYTYDANGNIETVTIPTASGNKTIRYTYDTAGQLIREDNTSTYLTTVWTYDNAGNILSEKVYPYTIGEPYELLEANSYTYGNSNWGDLLTAYNGQSITYDQIGNPLTYYNDTAWTFTWEHGRQLATMTSGGTTWTNTYNSDGLRTSRTNGTTTYNYYYDGTQLVNVTGGTQNIWIFYDGNRPVIIKYGDVDTYHYELNLQGDVIAILDSDGNRVVEYAYDAWGKILSITGSKKDDLGLANPLRYRGYVYDDETGMYYCQSRYYDPEIGRWLNADIYTNTGQGLLGNNMFAYCNNDPVDFSDYSGTLPGYAFLGDNHIFSDNILRGGSGGGLIIASSRAASAAVIENEKKFINNTSEQVVLDAEYVAFYKGALVIKIPGMQNTGFTFGAIFIGPDVDANLIRHEYGHMVQLWETDIVTYTACVIIPSTTCYWLTECGALSWNSYYNRPWEYLADQFGGASREHAPWAAPVSEIYWGITKAASWSFKVAVGGKIK